MEVVDSNTLLIKVPGEALPLVNESYVDINGIDITLPSECASQATQIQSNVFHAEHFMRLDREKRVSGWEKFAGKKATGLLYRAAIAPNQSLCGDVSHASCRMVEVSFYWARQIECRIPHLIAGAFTSGDHLLIIHQKRGE